MLGSPRCPKSFLKSFLLREICMQITVAVVYHSGYGHTAKQAEAVASGAREVPGTTVHLIPLPDLAEQDWAILESADAIILGSPTYMSGASAAFRTFAHPTRKPWS